MSVEYTKIAGDPKFALESPVGSESTGKSAIDEAVEKLESIPVSLCLLFFNFFRSALLFLFQSLSQCHNVDLQ